MKIFLTILGHVLSRKAKDQNISNIVIGRDGRTSIQTLLESLKQGLIHGGSNAIDIGQVPTPLVYYA
ncbi:MAG: hypothetical protein IR526_00265 [Bordetella sp.]|nr:MAG: hypothetical protein IR526_00265 [Bordetella sp.]